MLKNLKWINYKELSQKFLGVYYQKTQSKMQQDLIHKIS